MEIYFYAFRVLISMNIFVIDLLNNVVYVRVWFLQ